MTNSHFTSEDPASAKGFFTIKEVLKKHARDCEVKQQTSAMRLFWKAVFAGLMVGMGAENQPEYAQLAIEVYGFTEAQLGSLNLNGYLLKNLLPVTLGNVLGGVLCVGAPLYYLNKNKS